VASNLANIDVSAHRQLDRSQPAVGSGDPWMIDVPRGSLDAAFTPIAEHGQAELSMRRCADAPM
jgi:hypothetical protein